MIVQVYTASLEHRLEVECHNEYYIALSEGREQAMYLSNKYRRPFDYWEHVQTSSRAAESPECCELAVKLSDCDCIVAMQISSAGFEIIARVPAEYKRPTLPDRVLLTSTISRDHASPESVPPDAPPKPNDVAAVIDITLMIPSAALMHDSIIVRTPHASPVGVRKRVGCSMSMRSVNWQEQPSPDTEPHRIYLVSEARYDAESSMSRQQINGVNVNVFVTMGGFLIPEEWIVQQSKDKRNGVERPSLIGLCQDCSVAGLRQYGRGSRLTW